jgi:restriction endonuclease XhoI-like protein
VNHSEAPQPGIAGLADLESSLTKAVKQFWLRKGAQRKRQGQTTGRKDYGSRQDVTGGRHVDGLVDVFVKLLLANGVPDESIFHSGKTKLQLPGYFRAEKQWDLLVVHHGRLLACLELKSMGSSFGNNFNNRAEEVIGLGHDLRVAFGAGSFKESSRPWVGYLMLLADSPAATREVKVIEPHFEVDEVFKHASYEQRYCACFRRLVGEGLYNRCALLLASPDTRGDWREPDTQLTVRGFAASLAAHCIGELAGQ